MSPDPTPTKCRTDVGDHCQEIVMRRIVFALAASAVVVTMCVATAMSPAAGLALTRAEGNPVPMPINELVITAKQLPEQSSSAD
jgi:hypothetical protein